MYKLILQWFCILRSFERQEYLVLQLHNFSPSYSLFNFSVFCCAGLLLLLNYLYSFCSCFCLLVSSDGHCFWTVCLLNLGMFCQGLLSRIGKKMIEISDDPGSGSGHFLLRSRSGQIRTRLIGKSSKSIFSFRNKTSTV